MLADDAGPRRFRARWEHRGLDEHGYRFRAAPLVPADLKPEEDEKPGRARPVTVLDAGAWARFAHAFGEGLAPERPGEATLLQIGGTDLLLTRGDGDELVLVPGRRAPPGLEVVARHNLVEIAQGAARFIEAEAARTGVGGDAFLFVMPPRGHGEGLVLFDTAQKLCVAVTLPRSQPQRAGSPLSRYARSVVALTVEAHGIALIKNPVSSVGRLVNIFGQWLATLATRSRPSTDQPVAPLTVAAPMDLPSWERELDRLTGSHRQPGLDPPADQRRALLPRARATHPRGRRVGVDARQHLRHRRRRAAYRRPAARALARGAGAGGDGRAVVDDRRATSLPATAMPPDTLMPASMWRYLEQDSKVAARAFLNPWMSSDHTKVLLFDRRYAHLGGMNIGREYRFEWHDMMVELEGPVVGRFARDFERAWAHASALGDLAFAAAATTSTSRFAGDATRADYIAVRPLYTRTGNPQIYSALMSAARRAQSTIWVENPYLYENSFVKALVKARRRGVDVRVVMPSDSDLGFGNASNMVTANALIANGVRVYVYPGMTHIKAAIFDGWACIGSANFNKLSLRRNLEANIATSDPRFVGELRRDLFERDFADSYELTEPVAITGGDSFAEWVMSGF